MQSQRKFLFKNRDQAARLLVERLLRYWGLKPLILAIPRGGVPLGRIVADELKGELDLLLVHRLRAPGDPEYSIGSVSEGGAFYAPPYPQHLYVPKEYLEEEVRHQLRALELRRKFYTPHRPPHSAANRLVILVDDGISTGSTMLAAVREVDRQRPAKIVVAAPVAPVEAVKILRNEADDVEVVSVHPDFEKIGDYYRHYAPVTDEEVMELLKGEKKETAMNQEVHEVK